MTMGERIRQARLEAGLSQRQLAGEMMTRNMLSALEHDGANPSVSTLKYLAEKLCKPIGYFLGEDGPVLPELEKLEAARRYYAAEAFSACRRELEGMEDSSLEPEANLLRCLSLLALAKQAREDGKIPYCQQLLSNCKGVLDECVYLQPELERKWLIESALAAREKAGLVAKLPSEDEVLMLRAQAAMEQGLYDRAGALLEATEDRETIQWNFLRGEVYFRQKDYRKAAECYHRAEESEPVETAERLEVCYREMEDYKVAYFYAKKGKG